LVSLKPAPLLLPLIETLGVIAISWLKSAVGETVLSMYSRPTAACGCVVVSDAVICAASRLSSRSR
jgi:hypothetical protein